MKGKLATLACAALLTVCASASAQGYYTLPEVREQAAQGWHETYTDAFGRTIPVDVEVEVFGEEAAPVLKVRPAHDQLNAALFEEGTVWLDNSGITIYRNNPADFVFQVKSDEQPLIVHRSYGEKVDMDAVYMPEYGAGMTVQDMVDHLCAILERQGIPTDHYVFDRPKDFSVRCKVKKDTGEVVEPSIYLAHFWQEMYGLPIIAHAGSGFIKTGWPTYTPQCVFGMRQEDEFQITVQAVEETQMLAQNIPLCSFGQVKSGVEALIEQGFIREILGVRFGYAVYNDPSVTRNQSAYEVDYYLVPTWIVDCIYMDNPKAEYVYGGKQYDELNPDVRTTAEYHTVIVNAQTGAPFELNDKSKNGQGNSDYRGFLSWDEVK